MGCKHGYDKQSIEKMPFHTFIGSAQGTLIACIQAPTAHIAEARLNQVPLTSLRSWQLYRSPSNIPTCFGTTPIWKEFKDLPTQKIGDWKLRCLRWFILYWDGSIRERQLHESSE